MFTVRTTRCAGSAGSLILEQVAAGVAVRMSVLYQLLGGADEGSSAAPGSPATYETSGAVR